MDTAVTSRFLEDINSSAQVHNKSKHIIIALVKRQRAMEHTFISKMDKNLKLKYDKADELIAKVTATIDARLEKCKSEYNLQMDEIHDRQQELIDENNRLYKDVMSMKSKVSQIEARNETLEIFLQTTTNTRDNDTHRDNTPHTQPFMGNHHINTMSQDRHPILTPFQFLNPIGNHHVKEVESYKFQKAKLSVTCSSKDNVFTFYNTLRHIAGSFNILLLPLEHITKETGVCQLTADNCVGYQQAHDIMSTALHLKLTGNDYFKSFHKAQTYIQAAANNSNGFQLLYRILEIIHPRLRISKGGIHKTIEAPNYNDVNDDSIYTFITRYKNYLLYEQLSPENRAYNKRE